MSSCTLCHVRDIQPPSGDECVKKAVPLSFSPLGDLSVVSELELGFGEVPDDIVDERPSTSSAYACRSSLCRFVTDLSKGSVSDHLIYG